MQQKFLLPDVGGSSSLSVADIYVKVGDNVKQGDNFLMLESDKATVDLPSSYNGIVKEILVKIGDKVELDSPIAIIESASGTSADNLTQETKQENAKPITSEENIVQPISQGIKQETHKVEAPVFAVSTLGQTVYAAPYIRKLARKLNIDLAKIKGSGKNERITEDDVIALANANSSPQSSNLNNTVAAAPLPDFSKFGEISTEDLTRIQQISSAHLTRCWQTIPHVTQYDYADITELEEYRKLLNNKQKDIKYTLLAFLIKACCHILQKYPKFNASLDGNKIIYKHYYNIGFAVDTKQGLLVAVIKNVNNKGLAQIAKEVADLAALAREGKLSASDMQGSCFTVSSLGGYGAKGHFTPIINSPEVAILGVSTASTTAVFDGKQFVPRLMLPLSISYDHRIIDGALAAQFTNALSLALTDLRNILL
jgi:pyruvate dehydrogenase E2 component (dihydrolipoamide acetyltransferase)